MSDGNGQAIPIVVDTYLIATAEPRYAEVTFPQGSLVLDPFGIIADQDGVEVVRLGRR